MAASGFQVAGQFEVRFVAEASGCERVHTHDYPVLSTVLGGELSLLVGTQRQVLSSGTLLCVPLHQPHAVTAFSPDFAGVYTLALFGFAAHWAHLPALQESALSLIDLCEYLLREGNETEKCATLKSWLGGAAVEDDSSGLAETSSGRGLIAAQVKALLDDCLEERVPFERIARQRGCSKAHCNRLFRQRYGVTIQTYYLNRKAENARELLATAMPLGEVALESGFYDQSHMSRIFKGVFHVAPDQYRRNLQD